MRLLAVTIAGIFLSTACIDRVAIRPDQLNVVSGMGSPTTVGSTHTSTGTVTVVAVPTATVVKADGTLTTIQSPYDAIITDTQGVELAFDHPVLAKLSGSDLSLAGSNRAETHLDLSNVKTVEVTQVNFWKTWGLTMGVSLGLPAIVLGVVLASNAR
ncbi:MAG: hypothetical protein ACOZIN_18620 [Myxococcota bacterium]